MNADERLAFAFLKAHPEDAARLIERGDAADAAAVLASVAPAVGAQVYSAIGPTPAAACAAALSNEALAALVAQLPLDAAGVAMRRVAASRREAVLALLDDERSEHLRRILNYPDNSAGSLADPLVLALADDISVADAQRRLRGSRLHLYYYVYIVTRDGTLVGAINMAELMAARPKDALSSVMRREVVRLDAHTDLATVGAHPAWRDFDALPVVDSRGRFVGAIRHKIVRQMSWETGRPLMATIVELSELYWVGLSGILSSLARVRLGTASNGAGRHTEGDDAS